MDGDHLYCFVSVQIIRVDIRTMRVYNWLYVILFLLKIWMAIFVITIGGVFYIFRFVLYRDLFLFFSSSSFSYVVRNFFSYVFEYILA